jgi:hypothetical protein
MKLRARRYGRNVVLSFCLASTAIVGSGCFGSFALTRKLWSFNKNISENKFVEWLVFLVLVIIPVYQLFTLGDAIIFNSIEFWTNDNPLAQGGAVENERVVELSPSEKLHLSRDPETGRMTVELIRNGVVVFVRVFEPIDDGIVVRDERGGIVASAMKHGTGGDVALWAVSEETRMIPALEARRAAAEYRRGGARAIATFALAAARELVAARN